MEILNRNISGERGFMRITVLRIFIFTIVLFSAWTDSSGQLRYGFRFGGDFAAARLNKAGDFTLKNHSGFTGGLALEYQFEKCGFSPDIALLYGRHSTLLLPSDSDPICFGRNFIDIPLRLKYKFWLKSTHNLFAPMLYTGPLFSFRLDHKNAYPLKTKVFQPAWEAGIGFDVINFLQLSAGYRFGLGNAVESFAGFPDARYSASGWNFSATFLFDF